MGRRKLKRRRKSRPPEFFSGGRMLVLAAGAVVPVLVALGLNSMEARTTDVRVEARVTALKLRLAEEPGRVALWADPVASRGLLAHQLDDIRFSCASPAEAAPSGGVGPAVPDADSTAPAGAGTRVIRTLALRESAESVQETDRPLLQIDEVVVPARWTVVVRCSDDANKPQLELELAPPFGSPSEEADGGASTGDASRGVSARGGDPALIKVNALRPRDLEVQGAESPCAQGTEEIYAVPHEGFFMKADLGLDASGRRAGKIGFNPMRVAAVEFKDVSLGASPSPPRNSLLEAEVSIPGSPRESPERIGENGRLELAGIANGSVQLICRSDGLAMTLDAVAEQVLAGEAAQAELDNLKPTRLQRIVGNQTYVWAGTWSLAVVGLVLALLQIRGITRLRRRQRR